MLVLLVFSFFGANSVLAAEKLSTSGNTGKRFLTAFMENYDHCCSNLQIHLVSYEKPASVNVLVDRPRFNQSVSLPPESSTVVSLSSSYMLQGQELSGKLVKIISDEDISVFSLNQHSLSTEAISILPVSSLGTDYYIFAPEGIFAHPAEFVIANEFETAAVTVTVSGTLSFKGVTYSNKQSFSFTLTSNQVIQFQSQTPLTGTRIVSSKPVAVISGNRCFQDTDPNAYGLLSSQMYPVNSWGTSFIIFPLMPKDLKDKIAIISAEQNNTVYISIHNAQTQRMVLHEGSHSELMVNEAISINSTKPVMLTYLFAGGRNIHVQNCDPFLSNIVPSLSFSQKYTFVTMSNYYNYIEVIVQQPDISGFTLDGQTLERFSPIERKAFGFAAAQVFLGRSGGRHVISHESAPFGLYVYGIEQLVSYGYTIRNHGVRPEESLKCSSDAAEYRFPMTLVTSASLTIDDVHLADRTCKAQTEGRWVVVRAPFNTCGTTALVEGNKIVYSNTVYGTVPDTPIHRLEIPLKCEMTANETLSLDFHPAVKGVVGLGHYKVSLHFYHSDAFEDPVTEFPHEVDLSGRLYIEFVVESGDPNLQITADTCYSSPTQIPGSNTYTIIKDSCPLDSTFTSYESLDQRKRRFSIHVFKFDEFPEVYLFCDVLVCHKDSHPNKCTQSCDGKRVKRAISELENPRNRARLSRGPIVFPHETRS